MPICEWAAESKLGLPGSESYLRGDTLLLLAIIVVVSIYFSTFSAPLRRTEVDQAGRRSQKARWEANCVTERKSESKESK